MSFPKAKIHRFNEEITCAPPPGKYDPKLDTKVKGAVIDKSKRFVDQKIDSGSTESLDSFLTGKKGCVASTLSSVFRTPQAKKVLHTPNQNRMQCPVQTSTPYSTRSDSSVSLDSADKDRSSNSGSEILRLEEKLKSVVNQSNSQLLEKSKEISSLKEQINGLLETNEQLRDEIEKKKKILEECNRKLEKLKSEYDSLNTKVLAEREDHRMYCEDLKEEIRGLKKCIEKNVIEKEDLEDVLAEKQAVLVRINDKCVSLETELKNLQEENCQLILSHANEIRDLLTKHEVELHSVATAAELNVHIMMTKLDIQVQKLATELDNAQSEMHLEFEAKLKDITNDTKSQLQRIKEFNQKCCDNVLNIGNMVSSKLNEFIMLFKEYDEKYEFIVYERNKTEHERDELRVSNLEKTLTIIEIQDLADDYKLKLEKSLAKCKKYEITVTKMQETIKALSDRLFTSESDVEHLNEAHNVLQLEKIELCKGMAELEKDIINDVVLLKTQLLNKLDIFKSEAAGEVEKLREAVDEKQKTIDMLLDEVDFYQTKLLEKEEIMCRFESNMQKQNLELTDIKNQCQTLEEEITKMNTQTEVLHEELKQSGELVHELRSLELYHYGQIEMLIQKLDDTQDWVLQAREKVNILTTENEEKSEKIVSLKNEIIANKEYIQSMANVTNELRDKENCIESLKEQVYKANIIIQEKEKYIDEMFSDLVLEKERCTALENDKCKLENKLLATKEELQALQSDNIEKARFIVEQSLKTDQLKDVQSEMNKHIEKLTEENKSLQSKLTEIENKLSSVENDTNFKDSVIYDLERKLKEHSNIVANKEEKINSLNSIITTQEKRILELNALSTRLSQIEAKNQHLEVDVSKKTELLCEVRKHNQELSSISEQYKIQLDENIKLKQKLSETSKLLETEQNISESLRRKLEKEDQNKKAKLSAAENDLMQTEEELETQRKLIEQLNSRLAELEETVRKLQEERLELIERRDAAQKELKDLDQQLALALGHKNLKQKIRHINQVIESNTEMKLQVEMLSAENARLKKKSNKENVNVTNQVLCVENKSPKSIKKSSKSVKLTNSPSSTTTVLKDRNQL